MLQEDIVDVEIARLAAVRAAMRMAWAIALLVVPAPDLVAVRAQGRPREQKMVRTQGNTLCLHALVARLVQKDSCTLPKTLCGLDWRPLMTSISRRSGA